MFQSHRAWQGSGTREGSRPADPSRSQAQEQIIPSDGTPAGASESPIVPRRFTVKYGSAAHGLHAFQQHVKVTYILKRLLGNVEPPAGKPMSIQIAHNRCISDNENTSILKDQGI